MATPGKATAEKFGSNWNLSCQLRADGSIDTAEVSQIQAAQLILIVGELKALRQSIDSIRHFFHKAKVQLLIAEHHRTAKLKMERRRRARARARRKAAR